MVNPYDSPSEELTDATHLGKSTATATRILPVVLFVVLATIAIALHIWSNFE